MEWPHSLNRRHWDDRAAIHARDSTGFYRLSAFRAGADTLSAIETGEPSDLAGRSILHQRCHPGLDTLSLARRGAEVTGVDFSRVAIAIARALARETRLAARFVLCDVHETSVVLHERFDPVFATWGVLSWIPNHRPWPRVAASLLRPAGRLYLADAHPTAGMLEEVRGDNGCPRYVVVDPWRTPPHAPLGLEVPISYTGDATGIGNAARRQWRHPISEIVNGAAGAGFSIDFLHEHDRGPWPRFSAMVPAIGGLRRFPDGVAAPPLAFSLIAALPL